MAARNNRSIQFDKYILIVHIVCLHQFGLCACACVCVCVCVACKELHPGTILCF